MSVACYPLYEGPNFTSIQEKVEKVSPISLIGTGLRFALQKRSIEWFVAVFISGRNADSPESTNL